MGVRLQSPAAFIGLTSLAVYYGVVVSLFRCGPTTTLSRCGVCLAAGLHPQRHSRPSTSTVLQSVLLQSQHSTCVARDWSEQHCSELGQDLGSCKQLGAGCAVTHQQGPIMFWHAGVSEHAGVRHVVYQCNMFTVLLKYLRTKPVYAPLQPS